MSGKVSV